jgi:membrane associated rhomboid family serine protease
VRARQPAAIFVIAGITVLVSLLILLTGNLDRAAMLAGFVPERLAGLPPVGPAVPVVLTPLTATLVHGGMLHLIFNLVVLAFCGMQVERVLGSGALILLYLVGAYASAGAQYLAPGDPSVPMIGASGAISAVVGAYALIFGQGRRFVASSRLNRVLNVLWLAAAWTAIQWMTGYVAGEQGVQLAIAAHVGGFFAGLALERPLLLWRYRRA